MRRLVRLLDSILRRALGVFEFCDHPECVLRVRLAAAPRALALPACELPAGAPVLELHLWNEHIAPMPDGGPDVAWAAEFARRLRASFHALAAQVRAEPRFAPVEAVCGITVLLGPDQGPAGERLFQRLGFTILPHRGRLGRFGEFWENLYSWWVMWTFNPATLRGRRLLRLRRSELWMCRAEFLARYGGG